MENYKNCDVSEDVFKVINTSKDNNLSKNYVYQVENVNQNKNNVNLDRNNANRGEINKGNVRQDEKMTQRDDKNEETDSDMELDFTLPNIYLENTTLLNLNDQKTSLEGKRLSQNIQNDIKIENYELILNDISFTQPNLPENIKQKTIINEKCDSKSCDDFHPTLKLKCTVSKDEIVLNWDLINVKSAQKNKIKFNIIGYELFTFSGLKISCDLSTWTRLRLKRGLAEFPTMARLKDFPKNINHHFLVRLIYNLNGNKRFGPVSNIAEGIIKET